MSEQPDWMRIKITSDGKAVTIADAETGKQIKGVMAVSWGADFNSSRFDGLFPATLQVLCELDLDVPVIEVQHTAIFPKKRSGDE